mgnify:CR=1 FL=1|jgi:hypothetical protein
MRVRRGEHQHDMVSITERLGEGGAFDGVHHWAEVDRAGVHGYGQQSIAGEAAIFLALYSTGIPRCSKV